MNFCEEKKIVFEAMETKLEDENNILNKENKSLKDLIRKLIKKREKESENMINSKFFCKYINI